MVRRTSYTKLNVSEEDLDAFLPRYPLNEWCLIIITCDDESKVLPIVNELMKNSLIKYCHDTLNEIDFDMVKKYWNWSSHLLVHDMFLDNLSKFIELGSLRKVITVMLGDKYAYKSPSIIMNFPSVGLLQFRESATPEYISKYINSLLRGR